MKRVVICLLLLVITFPFAFSQMLQLNQGIRKLDLKAAARLDAVRTMHDYWPNEDWVREENIKDFAVKYAFGDLTGDQIEEAAALVRYDFGGSGEFTGVFVYSQENGDAKLIGMIKGGDRSHDGIRSVQIQNHLLIVESFKPNKEDCMACYGSILTTRYKWVGGKLESVGEGSRHFSGR